MPPAIPLQPQRDALARQQLRHLPKEVAYQLSTRGLVVIDGEKAESAQPDPAVAAFADGVVAAGF